MRISVTSFLIFLICTMIYANVWANSYSKTDALDRNKNVDHQTADQKRLMLDNNLKCVDLSDLKGPLPLNVDSTNLILKQTEKWELSSYKKNKELEVRNDSLGYPTVVKNVHGKNPDNKYYLYYAHHDPMSGIGCAIAERITGPYEKLANLPESGRKNSMVLTVPNYNHRRTPDPNDPSHYSSPCVIWNEDEQLWFMYFHYYNHYHKSWTSNPRFPGKGRQLTGLATCQDLSSQNWTIWEDHRKGKVSVWDISPVFFTTDSEWMQSESSYHAIQRLPDGQWLSFMRGTPIRYPGPTLGFAISNDGRIWKYFIENPVISQSKIWVKDSKEYRPAFIGYLGKNQLMKDEFLVVWSEHSNPRIVYSKTTDFKSFERDARGYAYWPAWDGLVSPWREGNKLYLFSGKYVHVMILPL